MTIHLLIKRCIDFFGSVIALIILAPVFLAITIAIFLCMGRPILFNQPRPGRGGSIFVLHKFRTMLSSKDQNGNELPDEKRLTKLGDFLRRTSLDEIPQLWNVAKGEMSFVGPRPLLVEYLELYSPEQARRHEVKPGITGWAQTHGRRTLDSDWEEKFRLDTWYVDHWSLGLDLKILLLTVVKVLMQSDTSQAGEATSEAFKGPPK